MPKVTGRRGFGRGSRTVTVIETKVHRSSARKARMAFFVAAFVVGLLTMTVAADRMHPVLAMLLGTAVGFVAGVLAWVLVRIWPMIRLIWWWALEISLSLIIVYGWIGLAEHTNLAVRLIVVTVLVGVPALVPWLRKRLVALAWCVIVRHRLRTCFAQFIVSNQSGSLPLIYLSRPTPVGERVWVQLRHGLALPDLTARLDKIAVACWADSVVIERASGGNAGLLRVDVKRREVLTATVPSPLVDVVDPDVPAPLRSVGEVPTALDLPDVPKQDNQKTQTGARKPAPQKESEPARAVASHGGEDISDWI